MDPDPASVDYGVRSGNKTAAMTRLGALLGAVLQGTGVRRFKSSTQTWLSADGSHRTPGRSQELHNTCLPLD